MSRKQKQSSFFSLSTRARIPLLVLSCIQVFCIFVFFCICLSETVFFDRFVYQKRRSYGYWLWGNNNELLSTENYGLRAHDIDSLLRTMPRSQNNPMSPFSYQDNDEENQILEPYHLQRQTTRPIRIALVGDSFLWGQGLKEKNRVNHILQEMLNSHGNFQVRSYSIPGDSILDHYIKYQYLERKIDQPDYYIFGLVNNDLVFNEPYRYDKRIVDRLQKDCDGRPVSIYHNITEYNQQLLNALKPDFSNTCILGKIAPMLPKENAFYLDLQTLADEVNMGFYLQTLRENGLDVAQSSEAILKKVPLSQLAVSKIDLHPSRKVNKVYAEIMEQSVLSFVQKENLLP